MSALVLIVAAALAVAVALISYRAGRKHGYKEGRWDGVEEGYADAMRDGWGQLPIELRAQGEAVGFTPNEVTR
jgi:hypothetical protein